MVRLQQVLHIIKVMLKSGGRGAGIQKANKHLRMSAIVLVIMEMQLKNTTKHNDIPTRFKKI